MSLENEESRPEKAYKGTSAAFDLRANITTATTLPPKSRSIIASGVHLNIPQGYVGLVCPRSGLAAKHGVTVLNAPGVIDPGYIADIGVILMNFGDYEYTISPSEKIAQLLILPAPPVYLAIEGWAPQPTVRGENGFGSSGTIE